MANLFFLLRTNKPRGDQSTKNIDTWATRDITQRAQVKSEKYKFMQTNRIDDINTHYKLHDATIWLQC